MGKKLYTITFLLFLILMPVLHVAGKDKEFSELENRMLAQRPELEKDTVLDGSFGKNFETYLSDQFPLRNHFLSLKLYAELAMGKRESNGVFLGKDGQLMQDFKTPDEKRRKKNVGYINALGEKTETYFLLAPTAAGIYREKLPLFASPYDEKTYLQKVKKELSQKVNFVDVADALEKHKEEYVYYKTDHHWTTLGAFYAYQQLCEAMGLIPKERNDFQTEQISDFYGSLYSSGNFTFLKPDTLELFHPKKPVEVTVDNVATGETSDSLYARDYLEKKDKYSVFLDNNQPLLVIKSSVKNGKKLAVVKDSYANCLIQFLTAHFEEIHVLDLRYLNIPVADYAKQNGLDSVLVLYNVQSFARETKLSLLK